LRASDYSLKRVSLTGLAESNVSAVGKTAEPDGMMLSVTTSLIINVENAGKLRGVRIRFGIGIPGIADLLPLAGGQSFLGGRSPLPLL
jgi:hypothetical protein